MAINNITVPSSSGQNGFFNKYPYTDFHELNLDWLLTTYQSLVDSTNEIIDWVNNHQIEYEEAIARLTAVENEIATFEQQVTEAFNQLKADIEADFAQQKAELQLALEQMEAEVDRKILQMEAEVNQAIANFENQFIALKAEVENEIRNLENEVLQTIATLQNILEANNQYVFNWVNNRLEEFINSLPEILTVQVYNPYRGEVTDIQTAINDIYSVACIWGLTAEQYDSLGLTASEYDALGLSAQEYDTRGYQLLYKDPNYYMLSPFTGEYVQVKEVVMDLAHLHMGGLTATEYDALELTATEYDEKELTAFQYDWFADELLTA